MKEIKSVFCGRVYTPVRELNSAVISFDGGNFGEIRSDSAPPSVGLDARNLIAAPGFVDLHIQGCGGNDFLDATPEAIHTIRQTALRGGCTSLLATTTFDNEPGAFERLEKTVLAIREGAKSPDGAHIAGIHLEGPFLNIEKKGGFGSRYIRKPNLADFRRIMAIAGDDLKMITIAPELEGALEIIKEAVAANIVVSLGHTIADYNLARDCFDAGANHITHVFNAMTGLNHREPGLIGAALNDERVFVQAIPDGIHLHPAVLNLLYKLKGPQRICLITDATAPCGLPEGSTLEGVGGTITIRNGAVRLPNGTLAGSALMMNDAVLRARNMLQVPLAKILQMSSLTPAEAIRMEGAIGQIKTGHSADMVLFDDDFRIHYVVVRGKVTAIE